MLNSIFNELENTTDLKAFLRSQHFMYNTQVLKLINMFFVIYDTFPSCNTEQQQKLIEF